MGSWRRWGTVVLLAGWVGGCSFAQAIDRGDGFAQVGDWASAEQSYAAAVREDPDSQVALKKLAEARQYGADAEVQQGRDDLAADRWVAASEHVERAQAFVAGHAGARELLDAIRDDMVGDAGALLGTGAVLRAYELALEASRLFPGDARAEDAVRKARESWLVKARAEGEAGRYAAAIAIVEEIGRRESSQRRALEPMMGELRTAWAGSLRKQAVAADKGGDRGSAFVWYAMAVDVAGAPADRAARDRLKAALIDQGRLSVEFVVDGPAERRKEAEAVLRAWVSQQPGMAVADRARHGEVRVEVGLGEVRCDATSEERVGKVRYVSGTHQVRNPEFERRRRTLIDAEERLERQERQELELVEELTRHERDLDRAYERDWERLNRAVDRAEEDVGRAQEKVERDEEELRRVQEALDGARREGRDVQSLLSEERRALDEVQRKRREAREARQQLSQEVEALRVFRQALERVQDEIDRAREGLARDRRQVLDARREVTRAHRDLLDVPPLVDEDVYSDYAYPILDWTRTCEAQVSTSVTFDGRPGRAAVKRVAASTRDAANDAHVKFGVRQDVLRFPKSDLAMSDEIDAQVVREIEAVVGEALSRRGQDTLSRAQALLGSDRAQGMTLLLVHALTGGQDAQSAVAPTLRAEFGLESVKVLLAP